MIVDSNSHAYRKLRALTKFRPLGLRNVQPVATSYPLVDLPLSVGESVLGVYENTSDTLNNSIVLSDTHCHVETDGSWASFSYSNINRVAYGKSIANKLDTLVLVDLHDGSAICFHVTGFIVHEHDAKTFDSYAIGAFLDAAASCA